MVAPTFVGCLVKSRLIGVIEANQKEKGKAQERNGRLIGVAVESRRHHGIRSLDDLPKKLLLEMEHFFISYNQLRGKKFTSLGRYGPKRALKLVQQGIARAKNSTESAAANGGSTN